MKGDGTPYRSYLYSVDLAKWLWTLLIRGKCGEAYNVGSDEAITIKELAYKVSECFDSNPEVVIKQKLEPGRAPERYVPCIKKVESNLSLSVRKPLTQAIDETIRYHRSSF